MKYIALVGLAIIFFGLGTINIEHHFNLPNLDPNGIVETSHYTLYGGRTKTTDIYLNDEIKGTNTVKHIIRVLNEASSKDTVVFHLAGYGGEVQTTVELINVVKASKANVIMRVESNVYSGHAYLATSGDELIMLPLTYLMFHTVSSYGYDCSLEKGTDRTIPNSQKCEELQDVVQTQFNKLITQIDLLTLEEKMRIVAGNDVYITSDVYNGRAKK